MAQVWYVDNAASGANDGSSWVNAWQSFATINWGLVGPGDIIEISGGTTSKTYPAPGLVVGAAGIAGKPIIIQGGTGLGHNGTPVLDGGNTGSNWYGVDNGWAATARNHVVVKGLSFTGWLSAGLHVRNVTEGVVFEDNDVFTGSSVADKPRGIDIRSTQGVVVRRNRVRTPLSTPAQTDCLWVSGSSGFVVEYNDFEVNNTNDFEHPDAVQLHDNDNGVVRGNRLVGPGGGGDFGAALWCSAIRAGGFIEVYSNLCLAVSTKSNVGCVLDTGHSSGEFRCYNNTIYGGARCLVFEDMMRVKVKNNILWPSTGGFCYVEWGSVAPTPGDISFNLLWSSDVVLAFSDEFNTLSIDTALTGAANWAWKFVSWGANALDANGDKAWKAHATYNPGGGAQTPAQMGIVLHEVVAGILKLYARINPDPNSYFGYGYLGGMISTELSHLQEYGTWECRAKFKVTAGQHWAMWLVTKDYFFGGNGSWPEIDMVEIVGGSGNSLKFYMNDHANPPNNKTYFNGTTAESNVPAYASAADLTAWRDWHVYKFVWTPSTMEWWIDDVLRMSCPNFVPAGYPMYFMISPEVAGIFPGPVDGSTEWPMTAEIDYVKIYEGATSNPPPSSGGDFSEDWTGVNNTSWNSTNWPVIGVLGAGSVADIQNNQGRFNPTGQAFGRVRAESSSGNIADLDLTVQFTLGGLAEQYHSINIRHTGGWTGNNPTNGYRVMVLDGFLQLSNYVGGTQTQNFTTAKTWNTSQWNMRFQVVGTIVRIRAWQGAEVQTWDIEQTMTGNTTGIISMVSLCGASGTARPILWDNLNVVAG